MNDIDQKETPTPRKKLPQWKRLLQGRTLCDDAFLRIVLYQRPEVARAILEPILGRKDFEIVELEVQKRSELAGGHSAVFDAVVKFDDGTVCDIEMQNAIYDAPIKRIRYYASMLDVSSLRKGDKYDNLPRCITIFIVRGDYAKAGKPIYHVRRRYEETDVLFDDESEVILVDLNQDDPSTDLGRLMHDLKELEPTEIRNPVLSNVVNRLKYGQGDENMDEAGVRFLAEVMPELCEEYEKKGIEKGIEKGRKEGLKEGQNDAVVRLYLRGAIDEATASDTLGISVQEFQKLVADHKDD